ncbi:hypothetical protein ACFYNZ_27155 [Streptomyces kebangsaanensis]|uniref:WXG100 family type VII secretion target n=1 Tax=Streptomyces kebangsaanensis TaxID=864058 RepID=A0ABW6L0U0_9ACTN
MNWAGADHPVGMRLNQLPADSGGGSFGGRPDLASSPAEKKAAAKALEEHIEPDTKKAGDWADEQTGAVVKEFGAKDGHGWLTSGAVSKAHKTWGEQVQNLMNRLSSEKAALRSSKTVLTGTDVRVGTGVRQSSALDRF